MDADGPIVPTTRSYRLQEVIGRGGFGTVYRAEMRGAGGFVKPVALKMLNSENREFLARLRDEARMLGLLRHRAIVQVDDLVRVGGRWAVVMEFHEGVSLDVAGEPMPLGAALDVVHEVAEALEVAWERPLRDAPPLRLLHRDVKPSNIHVGPDGAVTLLDFGVARADFDAREARSRAVLVGTPQYMAPERFHLEDSHAGDVFALGVTLVELVAGPVDTDPKGDERAHQRRVDTLLTAFSARVFDEELVAWVTQLLAWDANSRPTARAVREHVASIRSTVAGPTLRHWAQVAVPERQLRRDAVHDPLTGTLLEEESTLDDGATIFVGDDPPKPTAARPWGCLIAGALGLVGAGATATVVLLGVAAIGWLIVDALWGDAVSISIEQGFLDLSARLESVDPSPARDRVRPALKHGALAARDGKVSLWEFATFSARFEATISDTRITDQEGRSLVQQLDRLTKD